MRNNSLVVTWNSCVRLALSKLVVRWSKIQVTAERTTIFREKELQFSLSLPCLFAIQSLKDLQLVTIASGRSLSGIILFCFTGLIKGSVFVLWIKYMSRVAQLPNAFPVVDNQVYFSDFLDSSHWDYAIYMWIYEILIYLSVKYWTYCRYCKCHSLFRNELTQSLSHFLTNGCVWKHKEENATQAFIYLVSMKVTKRNIPSSVEWIP